MERMRIFTPSFWYTQTIMNEITNNEILNYQVGTGSLIEETIACLIGGYGIPSEIEMQNLDKFKFI